MIEIKKPFLDFLKLLKKIFLPLFAFEFQMAQSGKSYIEKIDKNSHLLGIRLVSKDDNNIKFYIRSSKIFAKYSLLARFSLGKCLVVINTINETKHRSRYKIIIYFITRQYFLYIFLIIASLILITNAIAEGKLILIIIIPIIPLFVHVSWFFQLFPIKSRIKEFFFYLGR